MPPAQEAIHGSRFQGRVIVKFLTPPTGTNQFDQHARPERAAGQSALFRPVVPVGRWPVFSVTLFKKGYRECDHRPPDPCSRWEVRARLFRDAEWVTSVPGSHPTCKGLHAHKSESHLFRRRRPAVVSEPRAHSRTAGRARHQARAFAPARSRAPRIKNEFDSRKPEDGAHDHGFWWMYYTQLFEEIGLKDDLLRDQLVGKIRESANWDQIRPARETSYSRLRSNIASA